MDLEYLQYNINTLFSHCLNASYLSNSGKLGYPLWKQVHPHLAKEITLAAKALTANETDKSHKIRPNRFPYLALAKGVRSFNRRLDTPSPGLEPASANVGQTYHAAQFQAPGLKVINRLYTYIRQNLAPYLVDAYIHGSLSTMDYTGYSDLDTLFIVKQEALEDPETIKRLERLFIRSTRFLYEFDPLQHHGHFFLMEADLKYYSQAFLPLSVFRDAASLLGTGTTLEFRLRDCSQESKQRFIDSIRIVRRYVTQDQKKLKNPYFLKGVLSHFMILPALFLQVQDRYVSKKESFDVLREQVPKSIYHTMDIVSNIRQDWDQQVTPAKQRIIRMIGLWNPLLLPYYAQKIYKCKPVPAGVVNEKLLASMSAFCGYLFEMSGLDEKQLEDQ